MLIQSTMLKVFKWGFSKLHCDWSNVSCYWREINLGEKTRMPLKHNSVTDVKWFEKYYWCKKNNACFQCVKTFNVLDLSKNKKRSTCNCLPPAKLWWLNIKKNNLCHTTWIASTKSLSAQNRKVHELICFHCLSFLTGLDISLISADI